MHDNNGLYVNRPWNRHFGCRILEVILEEETDRYLKFCFLFFFYRAFW